MNKAEQIGHWRLLPVNLAGGRLLAGGAAAFHTSGAGFDASGFGASIGRLGAGLSLPKTGFIG